MRLLFVHERFGALAGAEVNAWLTAAEMKQRGHTIGLAHGAATGKGENSWREVFLDRFPLVNGASPKVVREALDAFEPDAVYVHKMADLEVLNALVESGRPLVRMVHDHDIYCMRSYKYHPLTRTVCERPASAYCILPCGAMLVRNRTGRFPFRWLSYRAKRREITLNQRFQRMVVATDYMKKELLRNGFDPGRIEIHAPVPRTSEVNIQSSFSGRNLIVYAGQIIRGKGVDVLLESLAEMPLGFECVVLGEGGHRAYCQALSRELGLENRVHFKGYVPPAELQQYYAEASVAVVSSVWPEPFGAVGLEAMRYGLPVVAFNVGGIKEWLIDGHNGFLVPRMDRQQFAERIMQLLCDKALARQMGARGRQFVRDKFNFTQYIDGLESMFARVIAEAVSGRALRCAV
jgi:glycosyltransferase involved in cell wall biosynthesis